MQGSDVKKIQLLFYAIQTYFSILIKCVTKEILDGGAEEPGCHQELILGEFAVRHGIKNYNHMDFYCWPIFELENGFDEIIDQVWHSVWIYINPADSVQYFLKILSISPFLSYRLKQECSRTACRINQPD